MFKVLVLVLLLPLAWCKPHTARSQLDEKVVPNSLDERLQELQQTMTGVVHLLQGLDPKLAELRTRQDQIKQKQDTMKNEILARVDAKIGESSTKMNNLM